MRWVRPIITFIAVIGITAGFFLKMIEADVYVPLAASTITWWFAARDFSKRTDGK